MNISEYKNLKAAVNKMIDSLLQKYAKIHPGVVINDVAVTVNDGGFRLEPRSDSLYYVENGRGPGKFPPVDRMREWAAERESLPRDIESLAYLAGLHVSLHGTEGDGAWGELAAEVLAEWRAELEAALKRDFIETELRNYIVCE